MKQTPSIHPEGARSAALAAAERSNIREGLPPSSPFARELEQRIIRGELTYDQAIDALSKHYRKEAGKHA